MDSNLEDLAVKISRDLFNLENHALAVWGDILTSNPDLMRAGSGSIRTIVLSEAATLVANARPSDSLVAAPVQGTLVTHGLVTLDVAFRSHYLASAQHHKKLCEAVKMRWVEACMRVIKRIEHGMVTIIPTSEEIAQLILHGQNSTDMGNGQRLIKVNSHLQMLVWRHSRERVEHYADQRTFHVTPGILHELLRALKGAPGWN